MMKDIICITPVKHLDGVFEELSKYGRIIYAVEKNKEYLTKVFSDTQAEYLFTNPNKQNFLLDSEILSGSNIKVINTCSTGLNHIDLDYCKEKNIDVWSLKTDYDLINDLPSTSELAFGLMMSLFRNIPSGFDNVKKGFWDYEPYIGQQVYGKVIGVIGYGRLGKIMCRLFDGWGVKILIDDPYENKIDDRETKVSRKFLLNNSDVVFLHTHVTNETRGMVDEKFLSEMKIGSYLINTARGELVNENSIMKFIKENHLKGYATDVIKDEFGTVNNSRLISFSKTNNVIITPHVGGMTFEGQTKAFLWAVKKFRNIK